MTAQPHPRRGNVQRSSLFLAWVVVGLVGGFGTVALLTIGAPILLVAVVAGFALLWRRAIWGGTPFGLGLGVAFVIAYLGWLNRGGPGTVCRVSAGETDCTDQWSPWPFFVVAAAAALGATCAFIAQGKREQVGRTPIPRSGPTH